MNNISISDTGIASDYWKRDKRQNLVYYSYVDLMVKRLAVDAKSIIDIGSSNTPCLESFDWIPDKFTLDMKNPYQSKNVTGVKDDFLTYNIEKKYDFALCLQVLEHVPEVEEFSKKLFEISNKILISVPYKWPKDSCKWHIHDPVDIEKLNRWTGREPDYHIIVKEPLNNSPHSDRLIAYYHLF